MIEKLQVRLLNGEYQVYSSGLEHWAMCPTEEKGNLVASALNLISQITPPIQIDEHTTLRNR